MARVRSVFEKNVKPCLVDNIRIKRCNLRLTPLFDRSSVISLGPVSNFVCPLALSSCSQPSHLSTMT